MDIVVRSDESLADELHILFGGLSGDTLEGNVGGKDRVLVSLSPERSGRHGGDEREGGDRDLHGRWFWKTKILFCCRVEDRFSSLMLLKIVSIAN